MVEVAKRYMERGWAVFPVDGKIPTTKNGLKDASTEPRLASIWWENYPARGIALATGAASGVWALDLDGEDAAKYVAGLQDVNGALPETVTSRTRNGYHVLFQMPEDGDVRNSASKVAPGVDVRGSGGYIVIPPSHHPDGGEYRWARGRGPDDVSAKPAPGWLLDMVRGGADAEPRGPAGPLPDVVVMGGRNQTLASLAGSLRRRGASEAAILAALETENQVRCDPPLPDDEVAKIAHSVARYEPAPPRPEQDRGDPHHHQNGDRPESPPPEVERIDVRVLERIRAEKMRPLSVVTTPWPMWNRVCRGAGGGEGLAHGWHVIVGASSGAGKSLLATNLAAHAVRAGEHVCLISLEMSQAEVVTRLLSIYASTKARTLEHGRHFDRAAWDMATERLMEASGSIRVNRQPMHGLRDIRRAVAHYVSEGCRTVIVDYLQLAWVSTAETMVQQITEVSHTVRSLAQEHEILSVGLSQVNRQMSFGGGDMRKEGLLGGSSLENDADQVVLLSRPEPCPNGYTSTATLDKNRHGPQAEWDMVLQTDTLQMREAMPDELPSRAAP